MSPEAELRELPDNFSSDRRSYGGVGPEGLHFGIQCWPKAKEAELHTLSDCCDAPIGLNWDDRISCLTCDTVLPRLVAEVHQPVLIRASNVPTDRLWSHNVDLALDQGQVKATLLGFFEAVQASPLESEIEAERWCRAIVAQLSSLGIVGVQ